MSTKRRKKVKQSPYAAALAKWGKRPRLYVVITAAAAILIAGILLIWFAVRGNGNDGGPARASGMAAYQEKIELLQSSALTEEVQASLGKSPAGGQAGHVVFISICNAEERASVFCGTGMDLPSAWEIADIRVREFLAHSNYDPVWVKADVVSSSKVLDADELDAAIQASRNYFFRYGIAFDPIYETALLEAEANGTGVYYYSEGTVSLKYLNSYLNKAGREPLEELPRAYTLFQCLGWFCDEDNTIYELSTDDLSYGRRNVPSIDDAFAMQLLDNSADHLMKQLNTDGSFVYGRYPRFDRDVSGYSIIRHAGTIWSMVCQYRLTGDERLLDVIDPAIDYLLDSVVYADDDTAYILKEKNNEIEIGTGGLTIIALTEYMDALGNTRYLDVCRDLANGIVALQDQETGEFFQVLNDDFTPKEQFRIVYYDGEAAFALCRMYGMTEEPVYLDAAKLAVDYFIEEDYTKYKDHWVAYSMNEITKYVDDPDYYAFGLRNAQDNLERIGNTQTTYHTYLELLMATFELYDRIQERGIQVDYLENGFHLDEFMNTINIRTDRMLDGYFFPEYAMYMAKPQQILDTFMVRHEAYRVRIDDVQHNIGGYYLYVKNYDKLVSYGLLDKTA